MTYNIQILFIYIGTHHNPPTQIYMTIYYIKVEFFYTFLFDQATHPNRIDLSTIQNYILIFRKTCAVGIIYIYVKIGTLLGRKKKGYKRRHSIFVGFTRKLKYTDLYIVYILVDRQNCITLLCKR